MSASKQATAPAVREKSIGERFTEKVVEEFKNLTGGNGLQFTPLQKRLTQHLFIKIDQALKDAEARRKDGTPVTWQNINMPKLASAAIHRILLGLDALIENHISPIPYWNSRDKKYDVDLRVGYVGKAYYRIEFAIDKPKDVIYELVYKGDTFKPIKKSINNDIESYEFEITDPFNRGDEKDIVGGFGYIMYNEPQKNKLVIVTEKDFKKAEDIAKSGKFWKDFPVEMRFKTLVHRTTAKIPVDPAKINISYAIVEEDDKEAEILGQIENNANKEVIDIKPDPVTNTKPEPEPETEQPQTETEPEKEAKKPEQQPLPQTDNGGPGF